MVKFLQVNNAGASGVVVDEDALRALNLDPADWVRRYCRLTFHNSYHVVCVMQSLMNFCTS